MQYAKSTGGFYLPEVHGAGIPADAVTITDAEHAALMAGQSAGKRIVADSKGRPKLADPLAADAETLKAAALAEVRAMRSAFFGILAGLQSNALTVGDQAMAMAIAEIQEGGKQITQTDLSGCATKAQIDAAFLAAWLALVADAPPPVITAFKSVK